MDNLFYGLVVGGQFGLSIIGYMLILIYIAAFIAKGWSTRISRALHALLGIPMVFYGPIYVLQNHPAFDTVLGAVFATFTTIGVTLFGAFVVDRVHKRVSNTSVPNGERCETKNTNGQIRDIRAAAVWFLLLIGALSLLFAWRGLSGIQGDGGLLWSLSATFGLGMFPFAVSPLVKGFVTRWLSVSSRALAEPEAHIIGVSFTAAACLGILSLSFGAVVIDNAITGWAPVLVGTVASYINAAPLVVSRRS